MSEKVNEGVTNIIVSAADVFTAGAASLIKNIHNTYAAHNEEIFKDKLEDFLTESSTDKETFDKFRIALAESENEFFKHLWPVIDKLDHRAKAVILGRMFKAVLIGQVKVEDFLELCNVVQKVYINHLYSLKREYMCGDNPAPSKPFHRSQLVTAGLLTEETTKQDRKRALLTDLGKILDRFVGTPPTYK